MKSRQVSTSSPVCLQNSDIMVTDAEWETLPAVHKHPISLRESGTGFENDVFRLEKPAETRYRGPMENGPAVNERPTFEPLSFTSAAQSIPMTAGKNVFEYERAGNVLIVVPTGSLMEFRDSDIRNAYNDTYRYLSEDEIKHLLVDFSRLSYFGSTFVGMLIRLAKKTRQGGGEAVLCHLDDNMRGMMKSMMLLENTKTDFFWVPFNSREEAIASLDKVAPTAAPPTATAAPPAAAPSAEPQAPATNPPPASEGGGWSRFVK